MQQQRRRSRFILGVLFLGLLVGPALTASPVQAVDAVSPYFPLPSWDKKTGAANRFVVLTNWAKAAVLDKETGLVWEKSPSVTNNFSWSAARVHCMASLAGNHKGWRLPSVHELASLVDPTRPNPALALPTGHPFGIVPPIVNVHWTATTNAATDTQAWFVNLHDGGVGNFAHKLDGLGNAWCVRGGMNAEAY